MRVVQPTLGGPAVATFAIHGRYWWETAWTGALDVQMAGEREIVRLITIKECETPQLLVALGTTFEMLGALLD